MKAIMKPVHNLGGKNIYCPHYRTCLDYAVKNAWDFWDCGSCDYRSTKEPLTDIQFWCDDGIPFYSLGKQ